MRGGAILQVIPALNTGGAERGCVDVAAGIVAAGGQSLVISAGGHLVADLRAAGTDHHEWPDIGSKNPVLIGAQAGRLQQFIRRYDVRLVHVRSRAPAWAAWWAARRTGVPFVTTAHAAYPQASPIKRFYNSIMARGDRVIAISRYVADYLARDHAVGPERLRLIWRGIDWQFFDPHRLPDGTAAGLRARWGVATDQTLLLLPGRLSPIKGQDLAIAALAALPGCVLVLVGPGAERPAYVERLRALAAQHAVTQRVVFAGAMADMPAAYAAADLVLVPSTKPEGFGRTPIEAQAMGRLVVAADTGSLPDSVVDGQTGFLHQANDAPALVAAVRRALASDTAARTRILAAAWQRSHDLFRTERMVAETLAVYRELR